MFTENELKLKLSLIEAIQAWADTQCETNNWPNVHYGQKTTEFMTEAAFSVLMAVTEAEAYKESQEG
jgi:hypothetical protein